MRFSITGGALWDETHACYTGLTEYILFSAYHQRLGFREHQEPPVICVDSTEKGLEFFKKHVCQYMDPALKGLRDADRWWLSALNHSNPGFGKALEAFFRSFRQNSRSMLELYRRKVCPDYVDTVQQVRKAPEHSKQNFLVWLCAIGTEATIKPFLDDEFDFNIIPCLGRSYISLAATFRNVEVFHALIACGAKVRRDMVQYCLHAPAVIQDLSFQQEILKNLESETEAHDELHPFSIARQTIYKMVEFNIDPQCVLIEHVLRLGLGCFSHPPFCRSLFLGPEALLNVLIRSPNSHDQGTLQVLLSIGASLDFVGPFPGIKSYTALEWAVAMGYVEYTNILLEHFNCYSDFRSSIRKAFNISKQLMDTKHPRPCPFIGGSELQGWPTQCILGSFEFTYKSSGGVTWETDHQSYKLLKGALVRIGESIADESPRKQNNKCQLGRYRKLFRFAKGKYKQYHSFWLIETNCL